MAAKRTWYLVCGDCAADAIVAAGICEAKDVLVQHDVVSVGPLKPWKDVGQWRQDRQAFWTGLLAGDPPQRFEDKPRDLFRALGRLEPGDRIILLAACGASDVLFLASTLRLFELAGHRDLVIEVARYGAHLERPQQSLPMMTPAQLAERFAPKPLEDDFRITLAGVWSAVTASDPEEILSLAQEKDPWVTGPAMRAIIERFPSREAGLGSWDECLLKQCEAVWKDARTIIGTVLKEHGGNLDPVGDVWLGWRLQRMVRTGLLEEREGEGGLHSAGYRLTEQGLAVQSGQASLLDNGSFHDRICGTELSSETGQFWVRENGGLCSLQA